MYVIGTSGHVDHGKSTLVKALTGIDPDRLDEEKAREMTIDLGFSWMNLPNGETLGIIDVPGHRDFIENMLAGVGGIDAALLIVAADEGLMPQTREHLAILDLLGIETAIVVLTKIDLISDSDWLELVTLDIHDLLSKTSLANSPIIPVSAISGEGLDTLVHTLQSVLQGIPHNTNYHHPRLPVDRVFSVSGFGTVVTGTLTGGTLKIGDEIEFQPAGKGGRIRGLQSYKQDIQVALPGSRVAVNVAGIDKQDVQRGDVLTYSGQINSTILVDVYFRHLPDSERPLKHNAEVKFFCGASEAIARVCLLNDDALAPASEGWLQLRLRDEIPLTRGDRFILRYPSPAQTIGGGIVVNPHPGRRWKRFQAEVIANLETRLQGSPAEKAAQSAQNNSPVKLQVIQQATGFNDAELASAMEQALKDYLLVLMADNSYWAMSSYQQMMSKITSEVAIFHQENPLRPGILREELRSRLGLKLNLLVQLLEHHEKLLVDGLFVRLNEHKIIFSEKQEKQIEIVLQKMSESPFTPPSLSEVNDIAGEGVIRALIDLREIVQVQGDVIFTRSAYDELVAGVLAMIDADGSVDAKNLRDRFQTSRKYVIALLEHLDSLGITQRVGDNRIRGRNAPHV